MQIPAPRLAAKMSKKEAWQLHLPGAKAPAVQLTDQEQTFLARYSEHGHRHKALEEAGLASPFATPDTAQVDLAKANAILAKISLLPMGDVLSAIGGDKILYLTGLLAAYKEPEQSQNWRTAATLLGKIHGVWDQGETGKGQTILVINAPTCPSCGHEHSQSTNGIPFAIPTEVTNRRALEMSANE
jgi:hypothetical protein